MKKEVVVSAIVVSLLTATAIYWSALREQSSYVKINGYKITVEIAADPLSREIGLSKHEKLADQQGMLFLFPDIDNRFFWMKGMMFPIDIIWIKDGRIVGINENTPVPIGSNYPHYMSPEPLDRVLEVNAGLSKKLNLLPGQVVKFHLLTK